MAILRIENIGELYANKDNIGVKFIDNTTTIFYYNGFNFFFYRSQSSGPRLSSSNNTILELIGYSDGESIIKDVYRCAEDIYKKLEEYKDFIIDGSIQIDVKGKTDDEIISLLNKFEYCEVHYGKNLIAQKEKDNSYYLYSFEFSTKIINYLNEKRVRSLYLDTFLILINDLRKLNESELENLSNKFILFDTGELAIGRKGLYCIDGFHKKYYKNIPEGYAIVDNYKQDDFNLLYKLSYVYLCNECGLYHMLGCECKIGKLDNYHSCTTPIYTPLGKKSKVKLGFEIEKHNQLSKEHIIKLKKNNWRAEYDLSVSGGEYITPVLAMHEVKMYFKKFDFIFNYGVSRSCGGHIHFSSSEVPDTKELYTQMSPFRPLLWSIFPTRARNTYCSRYSGISDKYRDWHLRIETIEFRIFPGVEKMEDVLFRTELLKFIYNNRIKNSNTYDNYVLAKDIIINKIEEIIKIILIRYKKNVVPGIIERLKLYYMIEDNKKISIDKNNNITITDII